MTKHLGTLIQDMYKTLESRKKDPGPALRMSTLGEKCLRKLWYRHNSPEKAEPIPGRTLFNFQYGDKVEEITFDLIEEAGHKIEGRQEEVELHGVKGHIDGIVDGVVVDIKSANTRSIDKFKNHMLEKDDPFGYHDQLQAYAEALKDDPRVKVKGEVAFIAIDKELGHIVIDKYKKKDIDWQKKITNIRGILSEPHPPSRPYSAEPDGKSGNEQLPLPCRYCQYKATCWPGLRTFIYSSGPRYLVKVEREPDVFEVKASPESTKDVQRGQSLEEKATEVT